MEAMHLKGMSSSGWRLLTLGCVLEASFAINAQFIESYLHFTDSEKTLVKVQDRDKLEAHNMNLKFGYIQSNYLIIRIFITLFLHCLIIRQAA